MTIKFKTLLTVIAVMGITSCKSGGFITVNNNHAATSATTSQTATNARVVETLTGDWAVMSIDSEPVAVSNPSDAPYLRFAPNEENPGLVDVVAYNGCNFLNGTVALEGANVRTQGEFLSTMRMCPDAIYETAITTALANMSKIDIERLNNESFLYIKDAQGNTLMTLRKHNLNFLEGAWKVVKINGTTLPDPVDIQFVVDLEDNTIHGNAGCNVVNGQLAINMEVENGISFTNMMTSRMSCPYLEYEQQFLAAMATVNSARMGSNINSAKLLNGQGETVIELHRLTRNDLD